MTVAEFFARNEISRGDKERSQVKLGNEENLHPRWVCAGYLGRRPEADGYR